MKLTKVLFFVAATLSFAGFSMEDNCKAGHGTRLGHTSCDPAVGVPNPSAVYCAEQGGEYEIRDTDAGQDGVCKFADKTECGAWAFQRGECAQGGCWQWSVQANACEVLVASEGPACGEGCPTDPTVENSNTTTTITCAENCSTATNCAENCSTKTDCVESCNQANVNCAENCDATTVANHHDDCESSDGDDCVEAGSPEGDSHCGTVDQSACGDGDANQAGCACAEVCACENNSCACGDACNCQDCGHGAPTEQDGNVQLPVVTDGGCGN